MILNALRLLNWKSRNEPAPVVVESPPAAVPAAPVAAPAAAAGCCASAPSAAAGGCGCGEPLLGTRLSTSILVDEAAPACACSGPSVAVGATSCCGPAPEDSAPAGTSSCCSSAAPGLETATFRIEGLGCACEGAIVEKRVRALTGMATFILNPITNQMKVSYNPAAVSIAEITAAVTKAGASAVLVTTR